ncbi:hypothetical protein VQ042_11725 [Aurantimonas sp. A2-1-M11]|uniref:hypothetical protein n=1 Tax=Aurantimonas sp. A2-1-M11 TaxID=3113712 RepID=UPI002F955D26
MTQSLGVGDPSFGQTIVVHCLADGGTDNFHPMSHRVNLAPILRVEIRQEYIREKHVDEAFGRDLTIHDSSELGGRSFYVIYDKVCSLFENTAIDRIRYVYLDAPKAVLGTRPCVTEAGDVKKRISQEAYFRFQLPYNSTFSSAEHGSGSPQLSLENIEMPAILIGTISSHLLERFVGDGCRVERTNSPSPSAERADRLPQPFQLRSGKDKRADCKPGGETGAPGYHLVPPFFHTGSTSTRVTICGRAA